ncbi:glycoside hydrolase family 47 protein [Mycena maculata]|uniref:alpha-1,2-Mannosidase n=1 Tax=Mycena maculata TaxID=230809 RepID=A0AAD7HVT4_9AGAR|nr:glycoside hydrolase family 47 protein [Mycena maculata]
MGWSHCSEIWPGRSPAYSCHRDAAKQFFVTSYNAYKGFAFGHDDLAPVSETLSDGRNGWVASIVDAMVRLYASSSMWFSQDIFEEATNFSSKIDFSKSQTSDTTTIRYVGGLLSSYELSGKKYPALVAKAQALADKMTFAWIGDNAVPFGYMDFSTNTPTIATASHCFLHQVLCILIAPNPSYLNSHKFVLPRGRSLASPLTGAVFLGLAAQGIDPASGESIGGYVTWGGGSDSYLEYMLKYARLTNTDDPIYIDTWKTAVDSSIRRCSRHTSTVGEHRYLADYDGADGKIRHVGSHLACCLAGNWLIGIVIPCIGRRTQLNGSNRGKLLKNQTIVDIALELNDGCWANLSSSGTDSTGIGPEAFAYISSDGNFTGGNGISADQLVFYKKHGFYITTSYYIMRPEVLESDFQAWRITGHTKYLDRAASAIASFNKHLPATVAFAALNDVDSLDGELIDDMQSFWFAEVLKYLYLTFDDPEHVSLDNYVFNTDCQPFEAPPALDSYAGSGKLVPAKPFIVQSGPPLPAISPNAYVPRKESGSSMNCFCAVTIRWDNMPACGCLKTACLKRRKSSISSESQLER